MSLLNQSSLVKKLEGIRVCRGEPMICHLLFVDDSLIFCNANQEASQQLLVLLKKYALASGQNINNDKTTMIFSQNINDDVKKEILAIWGCKGAAQYEKYLGLPLLLGDLGQRLS